MAWRLNEEIDHGWVDNTRKGVVTGEIWLAGVAKPIRLELQGNGHPDLAGCRCTFVNPHPRTGDSGRHLAPLQRGTVGDMTVSHKVKVPTLPLKEWLKRMDLGLPAPTKWHNALYLEWYGERNGRVVIETVEFQVDLDLPKWRMTEDDMRAQAELSSQGAANFMQRLNEAIDKEHARKAAKKIAPAVRKGRRRKPRE